MAGIARSIELYQLAYRLAWPYVSDFQKNADPNVAVRLHDSIRRRLNQGATEPVLIASEALKDLELNGQVDNDETSHFAILDQALSSHRRSIRKCQLI